MTSKHFLNSLCLYRSWHNNFLNILIHLGTLLYKLKGYDADGDKLTFGVKSTLDSDVIIVDTTSNNEANVYLNKLLDREVTDLQSMFLHCILINIDRKKTSMLWFSL